MIATVFGHDDFLDYPGELAAEGDPEFHLACGERCSTVDHSQDYGVAIDIVACVAEGDGDVWEPAIDGDGEVFSPTRVAHQDLDEERETIPPLARSIWFVVGGRTARRAVMVVIPGAVSTTTTTPTRGGVQVKVDPRWVVPRPAGIVAWKA